MAQTSAGLGLGQLLLTLDRTMVTLLEAPRGLDMPVGSVALVDADDVRLGLAVGPGSADLFFLLGVPDTEAVRWLERQFADTGRVPAAVFLKEPAPEAVARAAALGSAVVAVEPRARWEALYKLVNHAFEHHRDRTDPAHHTDTDLFALAQSIADRTRGMISIEDEQSHVLAYSASNDEADELRRLTILGRAGPPEHLEWLARWGIFDALRSSPDVVRVAERPELGLRPRLAVGIHLPDRQPSFAGTIWLQQGSAPLAADTEEILRGAAVLAARILARLSAAPSAHTLLVRELLGLTGGDADIATIADELGITADGRAALVGFAPAGARAPARPIGPGVIGPGVIGPGVIGLSAGAFRADAQVAAADDRVYVLLPDVAKPRSVTSWARGAVAALRRELGVPLRAVVAAPIAGLAGAAAARLEVDRVFDSAARHPDAIGQVTSLDEARTTVLLDEIVAQVAARPALIDPRVRDLHARDPVLVDTLSAYLDGFGDVAAAAQQLCVHPNTVRYRIRRIERLLQTSLHDPDDRLVLALSLRAMKT